MKEKIVAEANFLENLIYEIYVGKEELNPLNWRTIKLRLLSIRDEARKEEDDCAAETHS